MFLQNKQIQTSAHINIKLPNLANENSSNVNYSWAIGFTSISDQSLTCLHIDHKSWPIAVSYHPMYKWKEFQSWATSVNGHLFPLKDAGKLFLLIDLRTQFQISKFYAWNSLYVPLQSLHKTNLSKDKNLKPQKSSKKGSQHLFHSPGYQNTRSAEIS